MTGGRPCCVCGRPRAQKHHVKAKGMGGKRGKDFDLNNVVWLCIDHHTGPKGIHTMGRHTFARTYNIDLEKIAHGHRDEEDLE